MENCPIPEREGTTNGALARHNHALKEAMKLCNLDREALREWDAKL